LNTSTRARDSSAAFSSNEGSRGGADQHHGAVLHHRQERVLLRTVEAVHLVDEQQRPLPGLAPRARRFECFLQVGDAGEHRGKLLEMQRGRIREQPRDRRLAGAGRSPENQRAERARLQHAGERAVAPEQMILPDHFGEPGRTQLVGERTRRIVFEARGFEQAGTAFSPGCSSTELDGDRLPAAHQRDRPAAGGFLGDPFEIARTRDLLVVHSRDHVTLLKTEILRERAVGDLQHHHAFGRRIEPQFLGRARVKYSRPSCP
jgi:hypothetical protein